MKGSTHLTGGILAGTLVGASLPGLAVATIAALMPDWFQINLPGANKIVQGLSGHRGISHTLIISIVVMAFIRIVAPGLEFYVAAGWLSHIALDILAGGVPALWPISKRITLAHIKTGGQFDTIVGACALVLAACLIFYRRYLL